MKNEISIIVFICMQTNATRFVKLASPFLAGSQFCMYLYVCITYNVPYIKHNCLILVIKMSKVIVFAVFLFGH